MCPAKKKKLIKNKIHSISMYLATQFLLGSIKYVKLFYWHRNIYSVCVFNFLFSFVFFFFLWIIDQNVRVLQFGNFIYCVLGTAFLIWIDNVKKQIEENCFCELVRRPWHYHWYECSLNQWFLSDDILENIIKPWNSGSSINLENTN